MNGNRENMKNAAKPRAFKGPGYFQSKSLPAPAGRLFMMTISLKTVFLRGVDRLLMGELVEFQLFNQAVPGKGGKL